jgi:hypothetical protein
MAAERPKTSMANNNASIGSTGRDSPILNGFKTPKGRKKPAPLKLIPDTFTKAVPTQRESLESRKHTQMEAQLSLAASESNEDYNVRIRESSNVENLLRPKSPGKKLFHKLFRYQSSETPPKISPEWDEMPDKAVKLLGKESSGKNKAAKEAEKAAKKRASDKGKMAKKLDFACAGADDDGRDILIRSRSRANTTLSATPSSPSTVDFSVPMDKDIRDAGTQDIRSIGTASRHGQRIPTTAAQRAVSESATLNTISTAIKDKYEPTRVSVDQALDRSHLQYMNNAIPPTPPDKNSLRGMRPSVTQIPSMDVKAILTDQPETPDTAFRIYSKGQKPSPLPTHVSRFGGHEYLNLVLNKPSMTSLKGASSVRSAYGFIISPSAELANGGTFSCSPSFAESPIIPRSAGLPKSRDTSFGSNEDTSHWKEPSQRNRALSRRWSDGSLAAWNAQEQLVVPCLPPTFYSPSGFVAPTRNFTRPSANVSLATTTTPS